MYSACLGRTNFRPGSKFGLTGREVYDIGGIEKGLKPRQEVTVKVTRMMSPLLFTLALPDPGVTPQAALASGAAVVATAHPDAAHPITNALVLPGIFRGALDVRATAITQEMLLATASAIADHVPPEQLSPKHLVPSVMDYAVAPRVAGTVAEAARRSGVARVERDPAEIEAQTRATIYEGHRPVQPPSHRYANLQEEALELHKRYQGVLEILPKIPIRDSLTLSSLYLHPGLPEATQQIISRPDAVFDYTGKGNRVAVVTDGSAVLGLGNIGPRAGLPVMEGKAILFHTFAGMKRTLSVWRRKIWSEIVAAGAAYYPGLWWYQPGRYLCTALL